MQPKNLGWKFAFVALLVALSIYAIWAKELRLGLDLKGGHVLTFEVQLEKGEGREVWEPRFTYHGFQYIEVTGFPGVPDLETLRGRVVHTSFAPAGQFACSLALFNAIQERTLWAYVGNFHGYPTDCPHREKNGWTGDAHLAADQGLYNFDSAAAYTKWVNDLKDEQRESGELPGIVPTGGWGYAWGNGPAWDSALACSRVLGRTAIALGMWA